MSTVEEKRRHREAFLNALYDMTEDNPTLTFPNYLDVATRAGVPEAEAIPTTEWLRARNLLEWQTSHWIGITSYGIAVVEGMRAPTPPPVPGGNVVQILGDVGGSVLVRQASPGADQIQGGLDSPESIAVIRQIVGLVSDVLDEAHLGQDDRADLEEDLDLLREEIEKPEPKRSALRRSLLAIGRMAEPLPAGIAIALAQHFRALGL